MRALTVLSYEFTHAAIRNEEFSPLTSSLSVPIAIMVYCKIKIKKEKMIVQNHKRRGGIYPQTFN